MTAKTKWFPANIKPYHVGVYQVKSIPFGDTVYAYWNGTVWGYIDSKNAEGAFAVSNFRSKHQSRIWRGLTESQ
jgi:hypothetical protein